MTSNAHSDTSDSQPDAVVAREEATGAEVGATGADVVATGADVVVTGANGLVGSAVCRALAQRGASVRAVVRRGGTAPTVEGVSEYVGDFIDADFAASVVDGASAVVTTVHPMGSPREHQEQVAVEGTPVIAQAAREAGAKRFVHISTAAVYDRSPGAGDIDESSALVADDAGDYAVTKRDTDAALAGISGLTCVLLRPPVIFGGGETSIWNTLQPANMRDNEAARHTVPDKSFAWVHVDDLAAFAADVASGRIASSDDADKGPVPQRCTPVNVAAGPATARDYFGAVCEAVGVDPVWEDGDAWTGQILADRAHRWGWRPTVDLTTALAEIDEGLRG
ncbi:MAG: NAD(P)H-binding protein [Ornithinimicrobium sp.]